MKKFTSLSILIVWTFLVLVAAPHQLISQNIEDHEIAIEISSKFQQGLLSVAEAKEILISTLSDYSHADGKVATLTQFINKNTGIENPTIHPASEQRGWSGCEVYWITNESLQKTQFFLKIYPFESKHFLPEIFGLSFMSKVKEVDSPKICGIGQCFINESRCFLILETSVKGISIQEYFSRVGQHQVDSKERIQAMAELCEAVHACGAGLARFHYSLPYKNRAFPLEAEVALRQELNSAIEELIDQPREGMEGIDIEKLQLYTESILQKLKTYDHLVGLEYDDIKTIHTFYDFPSKTFSLVNPDRLYFSISPEGETQGLFIKDIAKYILSLTLNRVKYFLDEKQNVYRKELLTEEEVNIAINMFKLGYQQSGGILPDSIENEYVLLQHNLFFIRNSHRCLSEPEFTRVKEIIAISLENIKSRLNKIP